MRPTIDYCIYTLFSMKPDLGGDQFSLLPPSHPTYGLILNNDYVLIIKNTDTRVTRQEIYDRISHIPNGSNTKLLKLPF